VELLVVIAILCLLLAILLPSFARAQKTAQRMTCISHMSGIGTGITGYSGDNQGILPPSNATVMPPTQTWAWPQNGAPYQTGAHPWSTGQYQLDWADLIVKYFDGEAKPRPNGNDQGGNVDLQPSDGNYYHASNQASSVVYSKRLRCPSQPLAGDHSGGASWGSTGSNGVDSRYNTHYMYDWTFGYGDIWRFPPGYQAGTCDSGGIWRPPGQTTGYGEPPPSFVNLRHLTDFNADRRSAVTEPCLWWPVDFGGSYDNVQHETPSNPCGNFQYDCTAWLPYLPHDGSNPPPSVTSFQIDHTAVVPPRMDNPSMNTLFLDGHVQTFTYQWMVNWEDSVVYPNAQTWLPFMTP
jgi:prepilin-type processing-associated H-X9-DG protein